VVVVHGFIFLKQKVLVGILIVVWSTFKFFSDKTKWQYTMHKIVDNYLGVRMLLIDLLDITRYVYKKVSISLDNCHTITVS
jgi:hypothetical protein